MTLPNSDNAAINKKMNLDTVKKPTSVNYTAEVSFIAIEIINMIYYYTWQLVELDVISQQKALSAVSS